ncbi:AAA family ATPase [Phormidium sp. LEGE 05292]|uniref:AAA family ATPase n=1 Tax=[Phormidium] sp. LEGE 05292 TaxID=767427 RepID=UPI001882787B|nr:ATP-binding protein [Phormidium sp. LEGE 05292]MBE9225722.1 AAA family ATPase [Phormidium sp. LEGE 05292]
MLEKVGLYNFKSHRSTELIFDNSRLHALVGQNSSGKTSVLQALYYMSLLADLSFTNIFNNDQAPQFITTIGQDNMSVFVTGFWEGKYRQDWEVFFKFQQQNINPFWIPTLSWKIGQEINRLEGWKSSLIYNDPDPITQSLKYTVYLKLVANNLAKAAYSDAIKPQVEFDGSGLAPTLDYLRNEAPERFQSIQEMLKKIVPSVQKIRVRRANVTLKRLNSIEISGQLIPYEESREIVGQEVVLDMNTGDRIPAHAISEGTMLALGLLTVLMNPNQPNLVLLDDVEQGLHPKAQRELMAVFKEIIQANPNLQIIFTTHSPYIVDELTPSQVHVLSNTESGFTRCKRLDEHPDVEWAKQTLTTGEFWDAEGEDWVVAGEMND